MSELWWKSRADKIVDHERWKNVSPHRFRKNSGCDLTVGKEWSMNEIFWLWKLGPRCIPSSGMQTKTIWRRSECLVTRRLTACYRETKIDWVQTNLSFITGICEWHQHGVWIWTNENRRLMAWPWTFEEENWRPKVIIDWWFKDYLLIRTFD